MAKYSAAQIYAYARAAGFNPDQAVTMTAIALAESGGRSGAHNTRNENSRGLWQINAEAHPGMARDLDLFSPRDNAIAAFRVSQGGRDISPWTVTHGGGRARYLQYRELAQAAAEAHGEPAGLGMWRGTAGYGDHQPAGRASTDSESNVLANSVFAEQPPTRDAAPPSDLTGHGLALAQPNPPGPAGGRPAGDPALPLVAGPEQSAGILGAASGTSPEPVHGLALAAPENTVGRTSFIGVASVPGQTFRDAASPSAGEPTSRADAFVSAALDQRGDKYIFGIPTRLNDPDPRAFDCSELVRWAAHQAGVDVPDGSWLQYLDLRKKGLVIPVEEGIRTKGALLFSFSTPPTPGGARPSHSHVAISLGDDRTIEARGRAYGVDSFTASTKRFQYAAVLPGMTDSARTAPEPDFAVSQAQPAAGGRVLDTDGDGLTDRLEQRLGLDPYYDDTAGDRLRDSYDLIFNGAPGPALGGATWNAEQDNALLAGLSGTGTDLAATDPDAQPGDLHGLALAQPGERVELDLAGSGADSWAAGDVGSPGDAWGGHGYPDGDGYGHSHGGDDAAADTG